MMVDSSAKAQERGLSIVPQVAARGHHHWRVEKVLSAASASTRVKILEGDARREEIARMLSGSTITEAARSAADHLLAGADPPSLKLRRTSAPEPGIALAEPGDAPKKKRKAS